MDDVDTAIRDYESVCRAYAAVAMGAPYRGYEPACTPWLDARRDGVTARLRDLLGSEWPGRVDRILDSRMRRAHLRSAISSARRLRAEGSGYTIVAARLGRYIGAGYGPYACFSAPAGTQRVRRRV